MCYGTEFCHYEIGEIIPDRDLINWIDDIRGDRLREIVLENKEKVTGWMDENTPGWKVVSAYDNEGFSRTGFAFKNKIDFLLFKLTF